MKLYIGEDLKLQSRLSSDSGEGALALPTSSW